LTSSIGCACIIFPTDVNSILFEGVDSHAMNAVVPYTRWYGCGMLELAVWWFNTLAHTARSKRRCVHLLLLRGRAVALWLPFTPPLRLSS
jgi:hypothetical protein